MYFIVGSREMSASGMDYNIINKDEEEIVPNSNNEDERLSCKFGRQCFRRNPRHRLEMAHPGDADYIVPDMPDADEHATKCKYGRNCYRFNPQHFQNFTHPRNINIQQNYRKYCIKIQDSKRNSDNSFDDNVSDDDPFACSEDSDYMPSDEEE